MLKIGFYLNEINYRGISNSVFLFAKNNKKILKNESIIFYWSRSIDNKKEVIKKFKKNFKLYKVQDFKELDKISKKLKLDYCYFQRPGYQEYLLHNTKNIVHAVFPEKSRYHGDNYAYVSNWLSKNCSNKKLPYVPLPIKLKKNNQDFRKKLNIPKNAKVFGYHGGPTSFDLDFVKDAVKKISKKKDNIYFCFMNINKFFSHKRVFFLKGTFSEIQKVKFINTCDAMLHARSLGESFGISCAEFAIKRKPVLAYEFCRHRSHFEMCKQNIIPYHSFNDLINKLNKFNKQKKIKNLSLEKMCSEKNTIKKFNKIFLKNNIKLSLNLLDYALIFSFYLKRNYFYLRHKIYINFYKIFKN